MTDIESKILDASIYVTTPELNFRSFDERSNLAPKSALDTVVRNANKNDREIKNDWFNFFYW